MAGFKTHIGTSMTVGACYGGVGAYMGLPAESCILAGGICGIAGILPDLDSKSGVPVREMIAFSAAIVPALMVDRFQHMQFSNERIVLVSAFIYAAIRYGVAELFKRYTVHRGMWHSIPAAATMGCITFLVCSGEDHVVRLFISAAAVLGFLTHLVLDEIWSIEFGRSGFRIKSSFGTALKFFGKGWWPNISTYGKLAVVVVLALGDPVMMDYFGFQENSFPDVARSFASEVIEQGQTMWR